MLHVGLDLSRRRLDVCLLSGNGESIAEFAAPADADGLRALARRVRGQRVRAVIESMDGARFVHDTLEEAGWEVLVADAQAISGAAIHERRAPAMPARAARRQGARSTPGRLCGPYALARSSSVPESRFLGTEPGTVTRPVSPRTLKEHVSDDHQRYLVRSTTIPRAGEVGGADGRGAAARPAGENL
jgi:hypothetical protein